MLLMHCTQCHGLFCPLPFKIPFSFYPLQDTRLFPLRSIFMRHSLGSVTVTLVNVLGSQCHSSVMPVVNTGTLFIR